MAPERAEITRRQLERAAELASRPDDPYSRRWAVIHETIAEAAAAVALGATGP